MRIILKYNFSMGRANRGNQSGAATLREMGQVQYVPGADHPQLLLDAIELWMQEPDIILEPDLATEEWKRFLGSQHSEHKHSKEYWERAREAILYQARTDKPERSPVFRCQPFLGDHPLDRVRGWSSDVEVVLDFADFLVENDQQMQTIGQTTGQGESLSSLQEYIRESGADIFKDNGRLITAIYVIDEPGRGFSVNGSYLREERSNLARQQFESGKFGGIFYSMDSETGQWETLSEVMGTMIAKEDAATWIVDHVDNDRLAQELGLEEETGTRLWQKIFESSSLQEVTDYLKEIGNRVILADWQEAVRVGREKIREVQSLYYSTGEDCYLNENEVIIDPNNAKNIRRVEVSLAESEKELLDLNQERIIEKIHRAVEETAGTNPRETAPGQKTLF